MKVLSLRMRWLAAVLVLVSSAETIRAGTLLNRNDRGPGIVLTLDRLGVTYTAAHVQGVRSNRALQPGSGFFYFEGRRLVGDEGFGFGLATANASLAAYGGSDGESFGADISGGMWYGGEFVGSFPFAPNATYGIAVDYRGVHPIAYVIARDVVDGPARVFKKVVLSEITGPLYILVYGTRTTSGVQQTINPGNNLAGASFELDPSAALDAAYYRGSEDLVLGWNSPPDLHVTIDERIVVTGHDVTAHANATSHPSTGALDGIDLSSSITWSESRGAATGIGATFTFRPDLLGTYELRARVAGVEGAAVSAEVSVTVISSDAIDSDGDGLSYAQEIAAGTDPAMADSDHDGLRDDEELGSFNTDPLDPDSDGDSMPDGWEIRHGLNPHADDSRLDPDLDGASNLEELAARTDPDSDHSYPGYGTVLLSATDKARSVRLTADRLGAVFTAPGYHGVRSDVSVSPVSGWFYFEGHRQSAAGNFGCGVASATAPLDAAGGSTDQSLGVLATGAIVYGGQVLGTIDDPDTVEWVGFVLNYAGVNPKVYLIVDRLGDTPRVFPPFVLTGITTPVHILVFGQPLVLAGTTTSAHNGISPQPRVARQTINAGADLVHRPFHYPAAYLAYVAGYRGAEFMGSGFGLAHAYAGRAEVERQDPVVLIQEPSTNAEIVLSKDGLGASYNAYQKSAVRANQAMIGEFRYFESHREVGPVNIGQGLINPWAELDPYCCVSLDTHNAPPSMSMNSTGSIWRNLVWQASFPSANEHYGFAVDYRGARPIVYCIVGGQLMETITLTDFITPIVPMLYGDPAGPVLVNTINFGTRPFQYDPEVVLANAGIDATELVLGWGDANKPSANPNAASRVVLTKAPSEVIFGAPISATALASDVDGTDISAFVEWSEVGGSAHGRGTHFFFTPTTLGVHHLRATVTDSLGSTVNAEAVVQVSMGRLRTRLSPP